MCSFVKYIHVKDIHAHMDDIYYSVCIMLHFHISLKSLRHYSSLKSDYMLSSL